VYNWTFGDGTTFTGGNPPNHSYSTAGSYTVTLIMTDATLCTTSGTATHTLTFAPNVAAVAASLSGNSGCAPFLVSFQNSSTNATTYQWNFGDGSPTVNTLSPTHTYTTAGTYTVKLVSTNLTTCNKMDSAFISITVKNSAVTPLFVITKIDSCSPYIISISNTSQQGTAASVYTWNYGDGTTFTGATPPNHTYAVAGSYTLTLTMTDATLCTTTAMATHTIIFYAPVKAQASPVPGAKGCAPFAVQFQNQSTNAITTTWDFGDGSALNTATNPSHSYTASGVYHVRLISGNTNSCKKADTAYITITVTTNKIKPLFSFVKPDSCAPYIAIFTDSSQGTNFTVYTWLFGDGNTYTGATPPAHTYAMAGTYTVLLIASDTSACNPLDTIKKTVTFNGLKITAGFTANDTVCLHANGAFINTATNGSAYNYFISNGVIVKGGAGTTTYQFNNVGSYTIIQVVTNSAACNGTDTFSRSVYVTAGPTADFTVTPDVPVTNMPVTFTNLSINAVRYLWDFGDQITSTQYSPRHMYNRTGQYNACLTAYNAQECPSMLCKTAAADIQPLANLPTAFSPNGDGKNDILYVRGAAIQSMDLLIFNRWGQLVFETTSQDTGWDGTFNGKPQEMDAYAYVLKVLFIDGTSFEKKGNVTLLR
jgi:gliding motility-associated-like protein